MIMEELYWCCFLAILFAEIPVTLTNAGRVVELPLPSVGVWSYLRYPLRAFFGGPDRRQI